MQIDEPVEIKREIEIRNIDNWDDGPTDVFDVLVYVDQKEEPRLVRKAVLVEDLPSKLQSMDLEGLANILPILGEASLVGIYITALKIAHYTPYKVDDAESDVEAAASTASSDSSSSDSDSSSSDSSSDSDSE